MPMFGGKTIPASKLSFPTAVIAVSVLSAILKIALLLADVVPFNADEAIVALMARHILQGRWPAFFYGQAYMGSLDASLVAMGFALFGSKVGVIRAVQILLYMATIISTAYLGKQIFHSERVGLIAALLLAIPAVNTTLYTTVSLGGYGEALLIGNLLLISAIRIIDGGPICWLALWGLLAGLGIWAFSLTLIYILPTFAMLLFRFFKKGDKRILARGASILLIGAAIGASPWIAWAIRHGFARLLQELFGSAIAGASPSNYIRAIVSHGINLLLFGMTVIIGLRPPWSVRWLALPLLPLALAFWFLVFLHMVKAIYKKDTAREARMLLVGVGVILLLGFIFTPFGADPSGRYFLPLSVPMAIFAASLLEDWRGRIPHRPWASLALLVILIFNLYGTIEVARSYPPGLTTQFDSVTWIDHRYIQELIAFLEKQNERRGYTNYWISYPLAFLSEESLIYTPRLPYHEDFRYTSRDNRYPAYDLEVEQSERVAYITSNHPDLDEYLRESFRDAGISWKEAKIGDYHVFYALSSVVRPTELGFEGLLPDNH
jgi:4-amino-4-deoxy-L-arabinose transferase-like glycosyltransferase